MNMSYLNRLSRAAQQVVQTQRRQVSEYAKKHGFEAQQYWKDEPKINKVSLVVCFSVTGLVAYDIIRDRKEHQAVFAANHDESKSYFKSDGQINMSYKPNMDFLMDQVYPVPKGDGEEHVDAVTLSQSTTSPDWVERIAARE